jgi:hypothetical protein
MDSDDKEIGLHYMDHGSGNEGLFDSAHFA